MTRPIRAALPALLLLIAPPALGQSSLGQPGTLAPPRPLAPPGATPAPVQAERPKPPAPPPPRPQAAPAPAPAAPRPSAAPTAPRPAVPATTPTIQQRPGTSNAPKPASPAAAQQAAARRKAAAAAAAGAAAGAAVAVARPPEPAPAPAAPPKPAVGSATNLPLPRFAALGSNQVNLRIGPDLRYKIEWTYQRKDLPVEIVEEHQIWRRIRDPEGTEGWVQRPLLTSRRTFLVHGEERALRRRPEESADPVAQLKPGVIGAIKKCEAESAWCEVRVGDYRGWIKRSEIWGVSRDEAVN